MFTMDEMLSKRNQRDAFAHFRTRRNGCGADGMRLSELEDYWKINHQKIEAELRDGSYHPGIVRNTEIVNGRGKRRIISTMNVIDRFIARLLAQKLKRYLDPEFCENSFAYQDGKGAAMAAAKVCTYIDEGDQFVSEMDIENFFDGISLDRMMQLVEQKIEDIAVRELIRHFLYCQVSQDGRIIDKKQGLIQGNPISPVLSNLYLHSLDQLMEKNAWHGIRFADNINIYTVTREEATAIYNTVNRFITEETMLAVNQNKSGIFKSCERRFLGYEFYKTGGKTECRQYHYQKKSVYHQWHTCSVQKIDREYHIIKDGVLNKKDYALLFENEDEKHHIPVEVVEQLNLYGEVTIHTSVWHTLSNKKIRLALLDKYDNLMGYYIPEGYRMASEAVLKQCLLYNDEKKRLHTARLLEMAGIHNMRANLRYYLKRGSRELEEYIRDLSQMIQKSNESGSVDELMLIEAHARQRYYLAFNLILKGKDFCFSRRTRRPPGDPVNALLSFGNTLLYNQFLQIIWKTSLDPRIGIVHAANRRQHSLNLDFADLFKPVIVDRIIFSLINKGQLKSGGHFVGTGNEGVYLNREGKRIFVEAFEEKMKTKVVIKGKMWTYRQLMVQEIYKFQQFVLKEEEYRPYKYY